VRGASARGDGAGRMTRIGRRSASVAASALTGGSVDEAAFVSVPRISTG